MKYISAQEAADRWNLSKRRVITLCNTGRIDGAQKAGATWILPDNAQKPSDARIKSGMYIKYDIAHDADWAEAEDEIHA